MRSLNDFVNGQRANGFASRANAEKKVNDLLEKWGAQDATASLVCIQREADGRWFPVVINPSLPFVAYAHNGVCVWM